MLATLIVLDRNSDLALGRQLFQQIKDHIEAGTLTSGWRLPPSRSLAQSIGVGRNTVLVAYEQLVLEGYLESDGRRGTRVSEASRGFLQKDQSGANENQPVAEPRLSKAAARVMAVRRRDRPFPPAFQSGLPEIRHFPHDLWGRLLRRSSRQLQLDRDLGSYAHYAGLPALKSAILDHIAVNRGVVAEAEQVMVLSSAQSALDLVTRLLLDEGDLALHEEPGYGGALAAFRGVNAQLRPIDVNDENAYLSMLESHSAGLGPRLIYSSPSHQFPTGRVMSLQDRLALLAYAQAHDAFILEDDYDSEFHFAGSSISCLQGLDRKDLVIYMGTFSKSIMPSLHVAYLVVPKRLVEPVRRVLRNMGAVPNGVVQKALADFHREGHFQSHIREMTKLYRTRRDAMVDALQRSCGEWLAPYVPDGGIQLPAYFTKQALDAGWEDNRLVSLMSEKGLEANALSSLYWSGQVKPRQGVFLGYAASDEGEILEGVKKLAGCIQAMLR